MKIFTLNLLKEETEYNFMPTMACHIIDGNPNEKEFRPQLVIPGGGYGGVSYREGERIALAYTSAGFHSFVIDYCVAPHRHPLPILNAAKAIELIRENADEWGVDPKKLLYADSPPEDTFAASISTLWNDKTIFSDKCEVNSLHKPNASILCYPVITSGEHTHIWSIINLTGENDRNEKWSVFLLELQVDDKTPPAFLWHTFADQAVPVENTLLYAKALRIHNIPFELHIYPDGKHGLSTASDETYWKLPKFTRTYPWIEQSIEWLYLTFGISNIEKE